MRETGDRRRRPSPYPRPVAPAPTKAKSSHTKRRRYATGISALAIAAAVVGGYVSTGTAYAEGDEQTITFNGRCGLVLIPTKSAPDKESLELSQGDTVTFVNNLGKDSTLVIGSKQVEVSKGESYEIELSRSSEAQMIPDCKLPPLSSDIETTTVVVNTPPPTNTPTKPSNPGNGDDGSDDGNTGNDDESPVGVPDDGSNPLPDADDPVAGDKVPPPSDNKDSKDQDDTAVADSTGPTSTDTKPAGDVEAIDQSQVPESSGILALLATVCLVGVGVAAARTMVNNRSTARA